MLARAFVNGLTLLNALCGLTAMALLTLGAPLGPERVVWAAAALLVGYVPDVLDGMAARALGASSEVGSHLDVNADTVSFNVATALLVVSGPFILLDAAPLDRPGLLAASGLAGATYLCAGLWRSSRLVVLPDPPGPGRFFWGMTTNLASFVIGAGVFVGAELDLPLEARAWIPVGLAFPAALAMISKVPYPDVVSQTVQGRLPRWPPLVAVAGAALIGPAVAWAAWVLVCAVGPVLRHVSRRG